MTGREKLVVRAVLLTLCVGCARNAAPRPGTLGAAMQQNSADPQMLAELQDLNMRLRRFDSDNTELHSEVARLQQRIDVENQEKTLLREQLADAAERLESSELARAEVDRRLMAMQASHRSEVGATLQANSSLNRNLPVVDIAGLNVEQDGDVIRIELPSDPLFVTGSTQVSPAGAAQLDQIAAAIRRHYPRQIVGVEAHIDAVTASNPSFTAHQLTATQSLAVVHQLVQVGQIAERQLFSMGLGANRPKYSNGDAAGQSRNRRIEIVIYPESIEST
ncbi:MAG: OmpA family protein [Planctomycetales bacterium]|nr:OmpA family protein [Planctomycetales bacterium]